MSTCSNTKNSIFNHPWAFDSKFLISVGDRTPINTFSIVGSKLTKDVTTLVLFYKGEIFERNIDDRLYSHNLGPH